jgi:excinuclease UvrABC helicase subunit UvrB
LIRRRKKQQAHNEANNITPKGEVKPIVDILDTDARAADSEGEYDTLKAQTWIDKYKVTTSTHPQGALFKNIAQVRKANQKLPIFSRNDIVTLVKHNML